MKITLLPFALLLVLSCRNEDDILLCDEKATLRDFTGVDGWFNSKGAMYRPDLVWSSWKYAKKH